jgi:hypothetical protein
MKNRIDMHRFARDGTGLFVKQTAFLSSQISPTAPYPELFINVFAGGQIASDPYGQVCRGEKRWRMSRLYLVHLWRVRRLRLRHLRCLRYLWHSSCGKSAREKTKSNVLICIYSEYPSFRVPEPTDLCEWHPQLDFLRSFGRNFL